MQIFSKEFFFSNVSREIKNKSLKEKISLSTKRLQKLIDYAEKLGIKIAFENTKFPGYVTEKIIEAWASGTIPIYYGDPEIEKYFNLKFFVVRIFKVNRVRTS